MSTTMWFRGVTTKTFASRSPIRTAVAHTWESRSGPLRPRCDADVYAPATAEQRNETHVPKCLRCSDLESS